MNTDFTYYIYVLIAIIVGVLVIKKVAGCLLRAVFLLILIAAMVAVYYYCFAK